MGRKNGVAGGELRGNLWADRPFDLFHPDAKTDQSGGRNHHS